MERKLAAIVSADVAGYSRLMGADEEGTLAALKAHRNSLDPLIYSHGGRIVKTTGDGLLVEYPAVVAAARSCLEAQKIMAERNATLPTDRRMQFRIGIHLGEVMVDGDDIFGDAVNIAARLQEVAEPGGISLSGAARDAVHRHIGSAMIDLGPQELKNIAEPVQVWRVDMGETAQAGLEAAAARGKAERSAIAVLPFDNMSNDPEQEYFVDGITEDLITSLSRVSGLRVIARNSTFAYKGQAKDIRLIATELDARYVLEGSVRKGGNRLRINAQLIDAVNGQHIWAERYDREPTDIFDLQDDITANIVSRAAPEIWRAEGERVRRQNVADLDAWDLFLRARAAFNEVTKEGFEQAEDLCRQAIEKDPNYAPAYTLFSLTLFQFLVFGYRRGTREDWQHMLDLGEKATRLDPNDADSMAFYAGTLGHMGQYDKALRLAERAVALNPSSSQVHKVELPRFRGRLRNCATGVALVLPFVVDGRQIVD